MSSCSTRSRRSPAAASTPTSTASAASRTTCPRAGSPRPAASCAPSSAFCDEIDDLLMGNEIFETRTRGIGVIPAELAQLYGLSGANLRASGIDWDLRRDGDVAHGLEARRLQGHHPHRRRLPSPAPGCRLQEIREATKIVTSSATSLPGGPDHGQGPPHHQGARGRGLRRDREPARRDGLLRRLQGRPRPVPGQDPHRQLLQRVDRAVAAAGRLRARHHHHPRLASTSSSGTSTDEPSLLARRLSSCAYWQQSILRSRRRAGRGAAAGRHLRLRVPVQDGQLHAEPARPHGGRPLRLDAAARRGRQVPPEGGHRPRPGRPHAVQDGAVHRASPRCCSSTSSCPSAPTWSSSTTRLRHRHLLRAGRVVDLGDRHHHRRLGLGHRSTRCSAACAPPASSSPTSCRWCSSVVGVVIQAGTLDLQRHRGRPGQRRDLRLGRPRQPVHPHPGRRLCASS